MKLVVILGVILFAAGCNQTEPGHQNTKTVNQELKAMAIAEGFSLLETSCFSCHSPNASMDSRIAPPMIAIKKHYVKENTSEEAFANDLIRFLNNPAAENSKMPGAIERFGLMPKMNFSEADIQKIAHYIYNTELEKPDWFEKHYEEEKAKHGTLSKITDNPLELGKRIAAKTQGTLGSNLKEAINSNGTEYALSFCSNQAIALTDSMGVLQSASVKRVSDKNRNPKNKANTAELEFIHVAQAALMNGQPIEPKVVTTEDGYVGYYPITTSDMCLQCHGKPIQDIKESTYTKIRELYPQDMAINYKSNELRGIWVVEMKENQGGL